MKSLQNAFVSRPALKLRTLAVLGGALAIAGVADSAQAGSFGFDGNEDGSLVTLSSESATGNGGQLVRVTRDGRRTVVSDFANPKQGPLGINPFGVGVELTGKVLVLDRKAGTGGVAALFRVDPRTGFRTLVSDFGDPNQGQVGLFPESFSLDAYGHIIVAGEDHAAPSTALLVFDVNPFTGDRVVVTDFTNPKQGPLGVGLERAAAIPGDEEHLLVTDRDFGPNQNGALFRVDRRTGNREIVSDFGNAGEGPLAVNPEAFVFEPGHTVLLDDENEDQGTLLRVDYVTGKRTLVSTWSDASQGPVLPGIEGIGEEADGQVLVAAPEGGAGAVGGIYRINPHTGFRTLVTDFSNAKEGPLGDSPLYVNGDFRGSGELRGALDSR